jgi:hypothetical protein
LCRATSNAQGTFICNFQGKPLPGFTTYEIEKVDGTIVASSVFERRGNCRDPLQAGSLCKAHD